MIDLQNLCDSGMARPGGFILTDRAVKYCGFVPGSKILDIGCGLGATVHHLRETYGLAAKGVDIATNAPNCVLGDGHHLPFQENSFDGVTLECSLSRMEDPVRVLAQVHRVLEPRGRIVVTGLYARRESTARSSFGFLPTRNGLQEMLERTGFSLLCFEDHTDLATAFWGQMILSYGLEEMRLRFNGFSQTMRHSKPGYCLIIGKKEGRAR